MIRNLTEVINTLIEIEESFISIVGLFSVFFLKPFFHSTNFFSSSVLLLNIWHVGVRIFLNLHHIHGFEGLGWVDDAPITLTLLQPLIEQVNLRIRVLNSWHLNFVFGEEPAIGILVSLSTTYDICCGNSVLCISYTPDHALTNASHISHTFALDVELLVTELIIAVVAPVIEVN